MKTTLSAEDYEAMLLVFIRHFDLESDEFLEEEARRFTPEQRNILRALADPNHDEIESLNGIIVSGNSPSGYVKIAVEIEFDEYSSQRLIEELHRRGYEIVKSE